MTSDERAAREVARLRELLATLGIEQALSRPADLDQDAMLARILATPRTDGPTAAPPAPAVRRTWGRRLVRRAVAVAAVLLLGAFGAIQLFSERQAAVASTPPMLAYADATPSDVVAGIAGSARAALEDLAEAAASAPAVPREGDIQEVASSNWYLETTVSEDGTSVGVIAPTDQTTWLRPDGSRLNIEVRGAPLDVDGTLAGPDVPLLSGPRSVDDLPPGTYDAALAENLPREPEALRAALLEPLALVGCDQSAELMATCLTGEVVSLFTTYVVPADVASSLWTVLAEEQAVVSLGTVVDRAGREGLAVAAEPPATDPTGLVTVLIGDPETGQLLGTETIVSTAPELGIDSPTVTGFRAILSSRWVPDPGPQS